MAKDDLTELEAALDELDELDAREREISAIRRKLHDKIDRFPTDELVAQEAEVSAQRRDLHARINELREQSQSDVNATEAAALLVELEAEERTVSLMRRKLHDRIAMFPNDGILAREREVSLARRRLHRRIDALREQQPGGRDRT